jgi:hypothetical protein
MSNRFLWPSVVYAALIAAVALLARWQRSVAPPVHDGVPARNSVAARFGRLIIVPAAPCVTTKKPVASIGKFRPRQSRPTTVTTICFPRFNDAVASGADSFPRPSAEVLGKFWSNGSLFDLRQGGEGMTFAFSADKPNAPSLFSFNNTQGIGPQCSLLKSDDTKLVGHFGGRYSKIYPGLSDELHVSEVLLGCEFEHRLSQAAKVSSAVEYARDFAEVGSLHIRTKADLEFDLDPKDNVSFRTGVARSADIAPNGEETPKLEGNMGFTWKF